MTGTCAFAHARPCLTRPPPPHTHTQPETVNGQAPPGLRGHTATLIGSKIFLYGGYDGRGRSNDLYLLDPVTLTWEHPPTTDRTPAGRQRHTACLVGSNKVRWPRACAGGACSEVLHSACTVLVVGP
jgi:hypothetical protein